AESKKTYLRGLAVTDSPASLGTTELEFSRRQEEGNIFSVPVELEDFTLETKKGLFSSLFNKNSITETQDDDAMNEKQYKEFSESITKQSEVLVAIGAAMTAFSQKIEALEKKGTEEPPADEGKPESVTA